MPAVPVADSGVADLARLYKFVKHADRFLEGRLEIPRVTLIEVHIIRAQPLQAGVEVGGQVVPRQPGPIRAAGILMH